MKAADPRVYLACLSLSAAAVACGAEPAPCACPPSPATSAAPAPTTAPPTPITPAPAPTAPTDLWAAQREQAGPSGGARLALDTAENLFAGRFEAVRKLIEPELVKDLSAEKLAGIVDGLVKADGPPVQVMDAWVSELHEKDSGQDVVSPAAEVLLRMKNGKRIGLILVFNPQGAVRGLWLRPI